MRYIQLNTRAIPASPDADKVFPFLLEDDRPATTRFRVALLVARANKMLEKCLIHLGFEELSRAHAIAPPVSLGLASPDEWHFYYCSDSGPFHGLTPDSGDTPELKLSHYLSFSGLTNDPVTVPDEINVVRSQLSPLAFNTSTIHWIRPGLVVGETTDWSFRWAVADGTTDDTRTSFSLLIKTQVPELTNQGLGFEFRLSGDDSSADDHWNTGTFKARDVPINGGETARLHLGGAAIETDSGVLRYEADPEARLTLDGPNGLTLSAGVEILYVRFDAEADPADAGAITVHSYQSSMGADLLLDLGLELPLIMGPIAGGLPSAVPLIVPLLEEAANGLNRLLQLKLELSLGEEWDGYDAPILKYDRDQHKWKVSDELIDAATTHGWEILSEQLSDFLKLGGFDWGLEDLLGDKFEAAAFSIGPDPTISNSMSTLVDGSLQLPMMLSMKIGDNRAQFSIELLLDLRTFRLRANRLNFRHQLSASWNGFQILDMGALALFLPERISQDGDPPFDGYFDFESRELVLSARPEAPVKPLLAIPGGFDGNVIDLSQRLLFQLAAFSPDLWPDVGSEQLYMRINTNGLSLKAEVITEHRPNVLRETDNSRALGITPLKERDGQVAQIVLIDNVIREAIFFGEFEVPSVDDLVAKVEIGMRQDRRGQAPTVHAVIDLDSQDGKPLANLSAGYLQMQLDDLRARMQWNLSNNEWDLDVFADASLFLSSGVNQTGGLDDLKDPDRLQVRNINLLELHKGFGELVLPLTKPVEFTCLDGQFAVSLKGLSFTWGSSFVLACEEAEFAYLDPGALEVAVEVGGVYLEFTGGGNLKMRNPERIGIDVAIGDSVRFRGEVAWVDNDRERYFAAAGTLAISGLPEAKTLLKLGSGKKRNGQVVPNVVLYGSLDYEVQLFSGVVAKNFGAGIGINNRLTGIAERPNAEEMLRRIDEIDPSRISGWEFVERNGFYLSIVGTTIIASNPGGNTVTNAYVAALLLSIDVDLNIVAAGRVWLASSVDFVRKRSNWRRPALVGAVAILPRDRLLTAAIESRPDPAIESSPLLSQILSKGRIKISFTLSPKLVDYYLREVSYRESFLDATMLYQGSFRLAYFDGTILVRRRESITGSITKDLSAGPGGFHCHGLVAVLAEIGGLLSHRGIAAYGLIAAQLHLSVQAWIRIRFSFTIGCGRWKKRISFEKTFSLGSTLLSLGLRGAVAFDESGRVGFAGELSISVFICGYRLSISPELKLSENVITDVRGRVAAFERRLDAYRDQLLSGSRSISHAVSSGAIGSTATAEPWLHYSVKDWHVLLPPANGTWLTPEADVPSGQLREDDPIPFTRHVTKIEFQDKDGTAIRRLLTPWARSNWPSDASEELTALLEETEAIMGETVDLGAEPGLPASAFKLLSDPRLESSDREYWSDIDRALLPDGVLPARMKTAEQILQSGEIPQDFNSTYGRLVEYAYWSQRSITQRRHRGAEISPADELEQRRGFAIFAWLRELQELQGLSDDQVVARRDESGWQSRPLQGINELGFVFRKTDPFSETLLAERDGSTTPISLIDPEQGFQHAAAKIRLLPPRQEYVVDREATDRDGEAGRLLVNLPVHLDAAFLNDDSVPYKSHLPFVSHLQVWRRQRGSAPVLIADQQPLPITFLDADDMPVALVEQYLFTDTIPVESDEDGKRFLRGGMSLGQDAVEYAVKPVRFADFSPPDPPSNSQWQPVTLYLPERDEFPVDLAIAWQVASLVRPEEVAGSHWTEFYFASTADEQVSMSLTDEWQRQLEEPGHPLGFEVWAEEKPIADSGFYVGAADDLVSSDTGGEADLREVSAEEKLISTSGKFLIPVEAIVSDQGSGDDQSRSELPATAGRWRFSPNEAKGLFRAGYAYRFYIRSIIEGQFGTVPGQLRPLGQFIAKAFSEPRELTEGELREHAERQTLAAPAFTWNEAPKLRGVAQVEWIAKAEADEISNLHSLPPGSQTPVENIVGVSAAVRPFDDLTRHQTTPHREEIAAQARRRVGVIWLHAGRNMGGAEIVIRDLDDSARQASFVCETKAAAVFYQSERDFSNDSAWRLTRRERAFRLGQSCLVPTLADIPAVSEQYRVGQTLFVDSTNPIIRDLLDSTTALLDVLDPATETKDWGPVSITASDWIRSLNNFERSPLNLADEETTVVIVQIRAIIRYLFLGIKPAIANVDALTLEAISVFDSEFAELLTAVEELDPQQDDFDDTTEAGQIEARAAFLDADYGRKLVAILRRRIVIGNDILATIHETLPGADGDQNRGDKFWLPRGGLFESLRNNRADALRKLGVQFQQSETLLALFPASEAELPSNTWAAARLREALTRFKDVLQFQTNDASPDIPRMKVGAGVVAKAAGLTLALQKLEAVAQDAEFTITRRPHHRIGVQETTEGKSPELVELRQLLGDADRGSTPSNSAKSESSIVALFNLYERLGFAVDIAAMDRLGQPVDQRKLSQLLERSKVIDFFSSQNPGNDLALDKHYVYVLLPREPDSEYRGDFPDASLYDSDKLDENDYSLVGLSFIRIAVVPAKFHQLMLAPLLEPPNEDRLNDLRGWLLMRGIRPTSDADLLPFARTLQFAHPRDDSDTMLDVSQLLPIRMTPLQLAHITVPHLDGFAHADWELPDRWGHRFDISARRMSRYELLLRWSTNSLRPQLRHKGVEVHVRRAITRNDGIDMPIRLPISILPHPQRVRFVFPLPPAGIRSLSNRISSVRTGYQGYNLQFGYELIDHADPTMGWNRVHQAMIESADEVTEEIPVALPVYHQTSMSSRLFRHERMVELDDTPYFMAINLAAHGLFEGDLRGPAPTDEQIQLPPVDPARRHPLVLAYRPPTVTSIDATTYDIEIQLTRHGDMTLPREFNGGVPIHKRAITIASGQLDDVPDEMLPDLTMGYHFLHRYDETATETTGSVYRSVLDVLMPWHPGYQTPPSGTARPPFVRTLESGVTIADSHPHIQWRPVHVSGTLVPCLRVRIQATELFGENDRRRIQVSCRGQMSPVSDLKEQQ